MIDMNAMILCDTYKTCHHTMYPSRLTKLVSYWTPRKSMFGEDEHRNMVFFGLQAFVKEFLMDYFDRNFFGRPFDELADSYRKYMNIQLGPSNYTIDHIRELHELGHLPLRIRALPEGSVVNMGIPCIEVMNTHPNFAWLVQFIECVMQAEMWKICNTATIGHQYFKMASDFYGKTTDGSDPHMAFSDFGMRGMSCTDEAMRCSASWLLSFNKTSTVPALAWLDGYYNADCSYNHIGVGAVSTEHSVISSNSAAGCDEEEFLKKMLTKIYPDTSFSFLGDTYDYWNFVDNVLPRCKDEILAHRGKLLVRPDSGDQYEIVVKTVQKLWDMFGGTENSKGYKTLDSHIGLILGDGATMKTVSRIWSRLEELGFASDTVAFGVGAFPFSATFEGDRLVVNTRDTYGVAMKSTYGEIEGRPIMIYKDPKTDSSLKRSHRGCCVVTRGDDGDFICKDGLNREESIYGEYGNLFELVFANGHLFRDYDFGQVRRNLDNEFKKYGR